MIENPVFLSVSGSHLYGIPDPEDVDIRGAHIVTRDRFFQMAKAVKAKTVVDKEIAPKVDFVSTETKDQAFSLYQDIYDFEVLK